MVGAAIEEKIAEGAVKRADVFITTKLWDTHHNPSSVMEALKDSLKKLRTDYVDMFLIHWPTALKDSDFETIVPKDENDKVLFASYKLEDVWKAMEECKKAGLAKNIGISNFNKDQTTRVLNSCTIKPANNQIEVSPYMSNEKLRKFCQDNGILVTAYAPLGAPAVPWRNPDEPNPLQDPVLLDIAKSSGKSVAQVILRWHFQNGVVSVPKSVTPQRQKENIEIFDFELSEDDMAKINGLNKNLRIYKEPITIGHPEYPFDAEY